MKYIYKSVPNTKNDESRIIEINENEGWKLYQIHDLSVIFRKEIPPHFICVWHVVDDDKKHGPFFSEKDVDDFCSRSFPLLRRTSGLPETPRVKIEKNWADPIILEEESRLDHLARICVSLPGEKFTEDMDEKTWTNPSLFSNRSYLATLYENEIIQDRVSVPEFDIPDNVRINVTSMDFTVNQEDNSENRVDPIDVAWQDIFDEARVASIINNSLDASYDEALQRLDNYFDEDTIRERRERQARLRHDQ